jgi:aerobic-type carbon monoxide dehydrogenase small subunit (CoxS/CutS family)
MTQLIDEHRDPTDEQIADDLIGNLCRGAAYLEIMDPVKLAAKNARRRPPEPTDRRPVGRV